MSSFVSIEKAIQDLQQGKMIILFDDESEQEGDLMIAAEKATPQSINFMTQYARGLVCLTLHETIVERLQIPSMPERNKLPGQAAFTVSIEAATGVTSGVSAFDRAHTIQVAIDPRSEPKDISMPGHVFPIKARSGGVLERAGHTEASVDLTVLAGLKPAAVLCEIMQTDGRMAGLPELKLLATTHHLSLVAISDLVTYFKIHPKRSSCT